MKALAIHGHPTRGKEVLEILEMLGGNNEYHINTTQCNLLYTIREGDNVIIGTYPSGILQIYTLEEFLQKYPYKVNDKVLINNEIVKIYDVSWSPDRGVVYSIGYEGGGYYNGWYDVNDLKPYKKHQTHVIDNKSTNDVIIDNEELVSPKGNNTIHINLDHSCYYNTDEVELQLPDNWKFKQKDGKMFGVRKQYPKTYEECKLLLQTNCTIPSIPGYREYEIALFQELLICRDAYWKIADNWKPYWNNDTQFKFIITCRRDTIIKDTYTAKNCILAFPTEEMRDVFFENFKNLIEKCKEFL